MQWSGEYAGPTYSSCFVLLFDLGVGIVHVQLRLSVFLSLCEVREGSRCVRTMKCEGRYERLDSDVRGTSALHKQCCPVTKTRTSIPQSHVAVKEGHEVNPRALQRNFKRG